MKIHQILNVVLLIILILSVAWFLNSLVFAEPRSPFPETNVQTKYFQGYDAYLDSKISVTIASEWNMENTINENDTVLWVQVSSENVSVGDIIYYENPEAPGEFIAHRVIGVDNGKFQTRGDANPTPDQYEVTSTQLQGMVIGVIYWREGT